MRRIETKQIKIGTYGIKAKCLSAFNDKIYVSDVLTDKKDSKEFS